MKERFSKWMEICDEEATKEDIEAAKKDFDAEVAKYSDSTYTIMERDGLPYAELLAKWNAEYNYWEKGQWKGIIMFDKVINDIINDLRNTPENPLIVDYQTLMYLYQTMANPSGHGLASAKAMAEFENFDPITAEPKEKETFVTYTHILQNILNNVNDLVNVDKKLKLYRERINIATAGIKFNWKISEIEEFIELYNFWIGEGLPSDEELQKM